MAEETVLVPSVANDQTANATNDTVTSTTPTTTREENYGNYSTINERYKSLIGDNTQAISDMYDANAQAATDRLTADWQINNSDLQAQKQQIAQQYATESNDLAVQYERARRAELEQANINGLNTGTNSQMQLARNSEYLRDFGSLKASAASQAAEQDRQIANLKIEYDASIRQALAENDSAKAAALIDEYNRQITQTTNVYQMQFEEQSTRAALLAAGGDYSGYAELLGLTSDQEGLLSAQWIAQNPDVAYDSGMVTADEYKAITGSYPKGYRASGSGGSGSFSNSWYARMQAGYDAAYPSGSSDVSIYDYAQATHEHPEMLD